MMINALFLILPTEAAIHRLFFSLKKFYKIESSMHNKINDDFLLNLGSCWIPGWSVTGIIPVWFFKRVLFKIYL